eukprot:6209114-Pleurochrysis_carterae.AAC.1
MGKAAAYALLAHIIYDRPSALRFCSAGKLHANAANFAFFSHGRRARIRQPGYARHMLSTTRLTAHEIKMYLLGVITSKQQPRWAGRRIKP